MEKPDTTLSFSFNQLTISCHKFDETCAFYKRLGLLQIVSSPEKGYAWFEAPNGTTLSIHRAKEEASAMVIYFERANLDAWCKSLLAKDVVFDQMPQDESWGWREARLRDPSGNQICLYWAGEFRRFPPWRIS